MLFNAIDDHVHEYHFKPFMIRQLDNGKQDEKLFFCFFNFLYVTWPTGEKAVDPDDVTYAVVKNQRKKKGSFCSFHFTVNWGSLPFRMRPYEVFGVILFCECSG